MRILLLSRYGRIGASSRLRSYQYLPFLESRGIDISIAPLFDDNYLRRLYSGNIPIGNILRSYVGRLNAMVRTRQFDMVWIEKEIFPWLPSWIELGLFPASVPMVVNYDDAVFHRYDQHSFSWVRALLGKKIDAIMRRANLVIVGNTYLGERARQAGARRIELLPTVVDTARYAEGKPKSNGALTIGWIGTPTTAHYLQLVAPVIEEMVASRGVRVVAVGANVDQVKGLPIEVIPWSEQTEVEEIQKFDIGIMPLPDEPFERGKCGYKLIQYMACGKPVVASPVGVNRSLVQEGVEGFLPGNSSQWIANLKTLCGDPGLRGRLGAAGRKKVEAGYSLKLAAPRLEALLRSSVKTSCAD